MENKDKNNHKTEISVIIPNFNGVNFIPNCLSSLQKQTFKNFNVIVVDNGSSDDSVNLIKKSYPWVRLIELSENTGFAKACNTGINASQAKHVAILNNDTEVMPDWLKELYRAIEENKEAGMAASKILLNMESREIDSVGMLIYPDGIGRQKGRGEIDYGQYDREKEILFAHGAAAIYRKLMLDEIGLFDEDFFAYAEDTDIGLRAQLAGWKAVTAPKAVVYHKYSATTGKYTSLKAMLIERNRIMAAVKNFPFTWLCLLPFYTIWRICFQIYGVLINKGSSARFKESYSAKEIIIVMLKAYASALKHIPLMLKKRRQRIKKISNREYIKILKKYSITAAELILKD
jgi:GT2 family glycosyltransferase